MQQSKWSKTLKYSTNLLILMPKDQEKKIHELKELIREFCEARDWDQFHGAKDLAIGIATEASEVLEHFRFRSEKEIEKMFQNPDKRHEIEEEMADVLYFLVRMAQRYDVDLSDALEQKMKKNEKRYPIEKFRGSNEKYSEF